MEKRTEISTEAGKCHSGPITLTWQSTGDMVELRIGLHSFYLPFEEFEEFVHIADRLGREVHETKIQ